MKSKRLTKERKREIAAIATKTDADIDFSDIPPLRMDWSGAEVGKFYRPKESSSVANRNKRSHDRLQNDKSKRRRRD